MKAIVLCLCSQFTRRSLFDLYQIRSIIHNNIFGGRSVLTFEEFLTTNLIIIIDADSLLLTDRVRETKGASELIVDAPLVKILAGIIYNR
ncbi:hypothetical protein QUB05_21955 [Microcoleus sp. F10-C6]|uniref:hypothetical protein n=1 Tax=unclassified Microcoleus TaxID=2642155 RepID=UPI002FD7886F